MALTQVPFSYKNSHFVTLFSIFVFIGFSLLVEKVDCTEGIGNITTATESTRDSRVNNNAIIEKDGDHNGIIGEVQQAQKLHVVQDHLHNLTESESHNILFSVLDIIEAGNNDTNTNLNSKSRKKRANWESFLLAHTLNPADPQNSNYQYWTTRDWNYWARRREPLHDYANNYKGQVLTKKRLNAVIIASPIDVEDSFTGRLIYYGYDDLYWSNRKFHTYILRRYDSSATSSLDVYDCGNMFFAAHLVRGRPIHFQTGFPSEYDYPFVSDLNFNLKRHCYRVPAESDLDRDRDRDQGYGREGTYYPGYDRHYNNNNRQHIRLYTFEHV